MPRKPEIPEHWKEGAEQPEWMGEADDYAEPMRDEDIRELERMGRQMQPEEQSDFIMGDDKTADEMVNGNELLDLKTELRERESERARKREIRDVKRKIRRVKYEPAYDIGASLKEGVGYTAGKLRAVRGTPEQRAVRKRKFKDAITRIGKGGGNVMDRLGGFGGGGGERVYYDDYEDEAIEMDRPRRKKGKPRQQFKEDMFGIGGGNLGMGMGMNLLGSSKPGKGLNLLGDSSGKGMGMGMGMNLLGKEPTIQRKKATRKKKRKAPMKKRKTTKRKKSTGKKRKTTPSKRRKKRATKPSGKKIVIELI